MRGGITEGFLEEVTLSKDLKDVSEGAKRGHFRGCSKVPGGGETVTPSGNWRGHEGCWGAREEAEVGAPVEAERRRLMEERLWKEGRQNPGADRRGWSERPTSGSPTQGRGDGATSGHQRRSGSEGRHRGQLGS